MKKTSGANKQGKPKQNKHTNTDKQTDATQTCKPKHMNKQPQNKTQHRKTNKQTNKQPKTKPIKTKTNTTKQTKRIQTHNKPEENNQTDEQNN